MLVALSIAASSLYFAQNLTKKLAVEEKKKVELIGQAIESIAKGEGAGTVEISLVSENNTIPLFFTDQKDSVLGHKNIDTSLHAKELDAVFEEIKSIHPPIIVSLSNEEKQFVYYGESELLKQLRYFPFILLVILFLFVLIVSIYIRSTGRYIQDRVWVGMSKETAHQLGTPLTSLVAWIEHLKNTTQESEALDEMGKDVERLQLIADRFSKIGSKPSLEQEQLLDRLRNIMHYMQKRASKNVQFDLQSNKDEVLVVISGPLFDWVIENMLRNALDAMDGKGNITIKVEDKVTQTYIDICDTGKGIDAAHIAKVFKPGFSTKKRGWGLGLSLARRIIQDYHYGSIFVKKSEPGKGTTFRIILNR